MAPDRYVHSALDATEAASGGRYLLASRASCDRQARWPMHRTEPTLTPPAIRRLTVSGQLPQCRQAARPPGPHLRRRGRRSCADRRTAGAQRGSATGPSSTPDADADHELVPRRARNKHHARSATRGGGGAEPAAHGPGGRRQSHPDAACSTSYWPRGSSSPSMSVGSIEFPRTLSAPTPTGNDVPARTLRPEPVPVSAAESGTPRGPGPLLSPAVQRDPVPWSAHI
jgi:hypothetical protein